MNVANQSLGGCIRNSQSHDTPVALNHSENWSLGLVATHGATSAVLPLATVVGFIDLDGTAQRPFFLKQDADLLEHAPCCFVRYASLAFDLLCGDSAAGGSHQIDGMEPRLERRAGLM